MAKPPLTVQNAAIATASVEIKTLTVSGKQVTLAVFRQLQERPLVLEDGTLAGQPWGIVNYHPDKCSGDPAHWHVVWQEGSDLRRSTVPAAPVFGAFRSLVADQFFASCVYDVLSTGASPYFEGDPPLSQWVVADKIELQTDHGYPVVTRLSRAGRKAVRSTMQLEEHKTQATRYNDSGGWYASRIAQAEQDRAEAMASFAQEVRSFGASPDELHARYLDIVEREPARRERHIAVREQLSQLPQLFIAV